MKTLNNYISEALIKKDTKININIELSKDDFLKMLDEYGIKTNHELEYIKNHNINFIKIYPKKCKTIVDRDGYEDYYPSLILYALNNGFRDQYSFIRNSLNESPKSLYINFSDKDGFGQSENFKIEQDKFDIKDKLFLYTENNIEQICKIFDKYLNR